MTSRVVVVLATIMLILSVLTYWILLLKPIIQETFQCPASCTCDVFEISVDCSSSSSSNIPDIYLEDVVTFRFNNNSLTCLRKDSFLYMGLEQLQELYMYSCEIVTLEPGAFGGLTKLQTLSLSYNKIREIKSRTFQHMSHLNVLYFANNANETLNPRPISALTKLKDLQLDNNEIEYRATRMRPVTGRYPEPFGSSPQIIIVRVLTHTFQNMSHLHKLFLDNNAIKKLESNSFSGLINLDNLWLHNNKIQYLPTDVFSSLVSLQKLTLSYNMIREIKSRTFENMSHLHWLHLDNNVIETLESDSFSGLIELETLSLDNNKIQYLPADVFSSLPSLKTLRLTNNQCLKIPNGTPFMKSLSLKILILHNCNISSLSVETFANVTAPDVLDLDRNDPKNFDVNTIKILSHLSILHLVGNLLECDSQFQKVLLWGQCHNINILTECDEPEYYQFTCNGDYSNVSYEWNDSHMDTDTGLDTRTGYDTDTPYRTLNHVSFMKAYDVIGTYVPVPVFVAVFTVGAAGNVALLLIIICNREMRTLPNMYIFNLALSDLISLTVNTPILHAYLMSSGWYYDSDLCHIFAFFIRLSVGLSAYFLAVLSSQRYHVTVNPLQYRVSSQGTWRVAVATVCGVWILAAAFAIPATFSKGADMYCDLFNNITYFKYVTLFQLLVSCIPPLCVIVFSFIMTARHIMKSALPISDGVQHPQVNASKNTAKIVIGLSIVFIISYVPYHVMWMYVMYNVSYFTEEVMTVIYSVSACLLVFNSCFNPVALCCTSSAFRRHFKRCLMCYCKPANWKAQTCIELI